MKNPFRSPLRLTALLLFLASSLHSTADVIYDATTGGGPVGSDLAATANWSGPTGSGIDISEYGGIDDGGTLAYKILDTAAGTNGNGPTFTYDYTATFPTVNFATDQWSFQWTARVINVNGTQTNAIEAYTGTGTRYLTWLWEDGSGDLIFQAHTGGAAYNLGANDDAYHTYAMTSDGAGTVSLYFDGGLVGTVGTISGGGSVLRIGGGSSGSQGGLHVSSVEFSAVSEPPSTTQLARVFADHMVFQRGEPVAVFGTDSVNPGSQSISVSFDGQVKNTTTDGDGNWRVDLDPMTANATGQDLVVTGSSVETISDVLVGEVWLAAGQSNMNWKVSQSSSPPHAATYPLIRMCNWEGTVGASSSTVYGPSDFANLTPEKFYAGTWQVMDASTVQAQSGVAYFFAHYLAEDLGIPIGIVEIAYGGTSTEAFISPATHQSEPHLLESFERPHLCRSLGSWTSGRLFKNVYNNNVANYTHPDPAKPHPHPFAPGFLNYTSMPHILPFTFKGAIWYQGESNAEFTTGKYQLPGSRLSDYQAFVMKTLVEDWRSAFGKPDFPFYMVSLPRINASNRAQWPFYREAQARVAEELDGVEVATVMEYGINGSNVHPSNKEPVGERLAAIARAKLYGDTIEFSGPVCTGQTIGDGMIVLHMDHAGGGLTDNDGGALRNFEIAGLDRNFLPATATIVGDTIEVSAAGVPKPVAVRHAWHMNADVDLYNGDGFSSTSFRTDRWIVAPGRTVRVACIGDSITEGAGISDPADRYPAQLGDILGTTNFEVRNYGKSGYGIYRTSKRYSNTSEYTEALAWVPDVVICNLGINDITDWGTYTQDQFETEYFSLVDAFAQSGQDPLFIQWSNLAPLYPGQTFYGDPNVVILNDWIREAAANTNAVLLDMETPLSGHSDWFPDNIHPNATGTREIAETTFCLLDELGQMDGLAGISEFMAINTSTLQDEDGDWSDWIELGNTGTGGLCLSDHYLTNAMGDLTLWQLPSSTVINPGDKLLVFASTKDRAGDSIELHSNFTLPDTGGSLALAAPDGVTILDSHDPFPAQHPDVSYGLTADGSSAIGSGTPFTVHIPADPSLGTTWTGVGFDDSSWTPGTSGVGYEGDMITFTGDQIWNGGFINGWGENNGGGTTETLNGTVLTYDHSASTAATTLDGTSSGWNDINDGDWTFETNIKLTACPEGFRLWFGIDTDRIIIDIYPDRTQNLSASLQVFHNNIDGAFHTFRVTHDSTANNYHVWRDDVLLTTTGAKGYDQTTNDSRLLLGDSTSGTFGNFYNVDITSIAYTGSLYGTAIQTDVETAMMGVNPGAYIRVPFTLTSDPANLDALALDIQYDDAFVAYLNGVEVASRNAPATPAWDSAASSDRSDSLAGTSESIDLTGNLGSLVQGANVLAIHGLNSSSGADRFLIAPTLTTSATGGAAFFLTPTPDTSNGDADTGTAPYATWKAVHGVGSDSENLDGDSLLPLEEFLTGGRPDAVDPPFTLDPQIIDDGGVDYFGGSFDVANGLAGLSYSLESSDDLVTIPVWREETDAVLVSAADNTNGTSTLTVRLTETFLSRQRKFLRVGLAYSE